MIAFLLFIISWLLGWAILSTLCAIGWRRRYTQAVQTANENARLWAEAQLEAREYELETVRLGVLVDIHERHYRQIRELASEAIRLQAYIEGLNPNEVLIPDRILDADHIE